MTRVRVTANRLAMMAKTLAAVKLAEKRYISTVYFHTLFLFTISKNKKYSMRQLVGEEEKEKDEE